MNETFIISRVPEDDVYNLRRLADSPNRLLGMSPFRLCAALMADLLAQTPPRCSDSTGPLKHFLPHKGFFQNAGRCDRALTHALAEA
jgi:hypothetical protein